MNEGWDPVEPLDDTSLGLLAAFREAEGPSADAEARMLAGLRARIEADQHPDDPATAVSAEPAPKAAAPRGNVRTLAVAAVAFAAGVALTLTLASPHGGATEGTGTAERDASPIARRHGPHAQDHDRGIPTHDPTSAVVESFMPMDVVAQAEAELPWPLTAEIAELASPPREDSPDEDDEDALPQSVEIPNAVDDDDTPRETARRRPTALGSDDDAYASRPSRQSPSGADDPERRGSGVGAWAPSLTPSPSGAGIGSAARNPAVGGSSAPGTPAAPGNPDSGNDGSSSEPPPQDDAPKDPPPDDTDHEEPEEDDPPQEEEEDETSPEEQCDAELQACMADAQAYCEWNHEGCWYVEDFCMTRVDACLSGDPGMPYPEHPPEEPQPYDCYEEHDMCVMETEAMCMMDKLPPEVCDDMYMQCDEILNACEEQPPPGPPW